MSRKANGQSESNVEVDATTPSGLVQSSEGGMGLKRQAGKEGKEGKVSTFRSGDERATL